MNVRVSIAELKRASFGRMLRLMERLYPVKRILALEIAGSQLIGAVAEAKGKRLSIRNFVAIERIRIGDDLPDPENIREMMERLDYGAGPAVLVTPLARSVQITMNRAKVDRLRHHQLCDALRWEVEPYTGISGTQAMIGAEKGSPVEQDNLMLVAEDEMDVDINVSVIEQNVYRAMKQLFRRSGLKLIRLYPPEVCFFMPLFLDPSEGAQAVFDIGVDYANFAIVRGRQPKQINTYPLGRDVLLEMIDNRGQGRESEQSLSFLLRQVPGPLPMILTGIGAANPRIVEYLDGLCEYGARPMELTRSDKLGRAAHEGMDAMYSIAAGAALRELSGAAWRVIGITDAIAPTVRIRQSVYLVPLVVAALLSMALVGHYAYMKNSKERYRAQTVKLEVQMKEKKQKFDAYETLKKELDELERKTKMTRKKIEFLRSGSDDNLIHLIRVLRAFLALPLAMQLESVRQEQEKFILMGTAQDFAAVGSFAVSLQRYPWCRVVDIRGLEPGSDDSLRFTIEMKTAPDDSRGVVAGP